MKPFYKLRDWIDKRFLERTAISLNTNAIDLLEKNPSLVFPEFVSFNKSPKLIDLFIKCPYFFSINFLSLSQNPVVIDFLKENPDLIYWDFLSKNINGISILEKNIDKINWDNLSMNPNAISILENNIDKINWDVFCNNPNGMHIIEKNLDKINWNILCESPYALSILENNFDMINWNALSKNTNPTLKYILFQKLKEQNRKTHLEYKNHEKIMDKLLLKSGRVNKYKLHENNYWNYISSNPDPKNIEILEQNLNRINISDLSRNSHPIAIKLLKEYLSNKDEWYNMSLYENLHKLQIDWIELCSNPNPEVIDILKNNPDKIYWPELSKNSSNTAIDFLKENIDKIDWHELCENTNPRIIELFEENLDKINFDKIIWALLSKNENIFEYDYQRMSIERTNIILEELMQKTWHPSKIEQILEYDSDM